MKAKRFIVLALVLTMVIGLLTSVAYAAETEKKFKKAERPDALTKIELLDRYRDVRQKVEKGKISRILDFKKLPAYRGFKDFMSKLPCTNENCDAEAERLPCVRHPGSVKRLDKFSDLVQRIPAG